MQLPKRKIIRLKNYDYSQEGVYFVTICTHNKACIFGHIIDNQMRLSPYGQIALDEISVTQDKRADENVSIDNFIVMPNHVHMLINVGSRLAVTENVASFEEPMKKSLASIIGGYKSAVTRNINKIAQADKASHVPTIWQARYYEHIIRNEKSYNEIWQYIDNNVILWEKEDF